MQSGDNKNDKGKHSLEELRYIEEARALHGENRNLNIKLSIASAFQSMWIKAYDALLHHEVRVRDLPEYNDHAAIDRALEVGITAEGGSRVMDYIKRVSNAVDAAVRRKSFKKV